MALLEIRHLTKRFGGLTAVNDVSMDVDTGEIVGVIGPNGSGKTTLINLVSGLYKPTRGNVRLDGRGIAGRPPYEISRLGVARTFQQPRLLRDATVFDNVLIGTHNVGRRGLVGALFGGKRARTEEQMLRQRARDAVEFVGLTSRAEIRAAQLTAGEMRLVNVARALAADAKLMLLDEPAAGLNSAESDQLRMKLVDLPKRGIAVFLVDHDMPLVMQVASRVVVLNYGAIIARGPAEEVQSNPAVIEAYLGRRAARELMATRESA